MLTFNCIRDFFLSSLCWETGHSITYHYRDQIYTHLASSSGPALPVSPGRTGIASGKVRMGGGVVVLPAASRAVLAVVEVSSE